MALVKRIYQRHLHSALERVMPTALPGFAFQELRLTNKERRGATLFAGSRLYSRAVPEGTVFIHFIPHSRQERFHAEIGWSISGRFPVQLSSATPLTRPANELDEEEWLVYFGELYHRKHGLGHLGWDVWTCSVPYDDPNFLKIFMEEDSALVTEDQAKLRVETAVEACVKDLQEVAVPYLDEWTERRRTRERGASP